MLGIVEATFRKQINLSDGHHGHQRGLSPACHGVVLLMDDSITVPQHAVSPLAEHNSGTAPPHKRISLCVYTGRNYSGSNGDKGKKNISYRNTHFFITGEQFEISKIWGAWECRQPILTIQTENLGWKQVSSSSLIWLNQSGRTALKKVKKGEQNHLQ